MFLFLVVSLFLSLFSFILYDPVKSSFFLVLSLLQLSVIFSFSGFVWYSYFVCLLFLSGVFVIVVYFSSISKFFFLEAHNSSFVFLIGFLFFSSFCFSTFSFINLFGFYFFYFFFIIFFIVLMLLFFLLFMSYFLNFSGGLRKF